MIDFDQMRSELGLPVHMQDWGIVYSNKDRLREFCTYFINNDGLIDDDAHLEMVELIFASAEDFVAEFSIAAVPEFSIAIRKVRKVGDFMVEHWHDSWGKGFPNPKCIQLSRLIEENRDF